MLIAAPVITGKLLGYRDDDGPRTEFSSAEIMAASGLLLLIALHVGDGMIFRHHTADCAWTKNSSLVAVPGAFQVCDAWGLMTGRRGPFTFTLHASGTGDSYSGRMPSASGACEDVRLTWIEGHAFIPFFYSDLVDELRSPDYNSHRAVLVGDEYRQRLTVEAVTADPNLLMIDVTISSVRVPHSPLDPATYYLNMYGKWFLHLTLKDLNAELVVRSLGAKAASASSTNSTSRSKRKLKGAPSAAAVAPVANAATGAGAAPFALFNTRRPNDDTCRGDPIAGSDGGKAYTFKRAVIGDEFGWLWYKRRLPVGHVGCAPCQFTQVAVRTLHWQCSVVSALIDADSAWSQRLIALSTDPATGREHYTFDAASYAGPGRVRVTITVDAGNGTALVTITSAEQTGPRNGEHPTSLSSHPAAAVDCGSAAKNLKSCDGRIFVATAAVGLMALVAFIGYCSWSRFRSDDALPSAAPAAATKAKVYLSARDRGAAPPGTTAGAAKGKAAFASSRSNALVLVAISMALLGGIALPAAMLHWDAFCGTEPQHDSCTAAADSAPTGGAQALLASVASPGPPPTVVVQVPNVVAVPPPPPPADPPSLPVTAPTPAAGINILFALIGRDVATELPYVLRNIERLTLALRRRRVGTGKPLLSHSRVLLVENDSIDDTVAVMRRVGERMRKASNGVIDFEVRSLQHLRGNKKDFTALARARNEYLAVVRNESSPISWDYLIAVDTDMCHPWNVTAHADALAALLPSAGQEWHALLANGICPGGWRRPNPSNASDPEGVPAPVNSREADAFPIYCDMLAFRDTDGVRPPDFPIRLHPGQCEHGSGPQPQPWAPTCESIAGQPTFRVSSGFGGLAVYHGDTLRDHPACVYSSGVDWMECEHLSFSRCLHDAGAQLRVGPSLLINWEGCEGLLDSELNDDADPDRDHAAG